MSMFSSTAYANRKVLSPQWLLSQEMASCLLSNRRQRKTSLTSCWMTQRAHVPEAGDSYFLRCDCCFFMPYASELTLSKRRKAQNRTAQRAYRDREKGRLSIALQRVREMESELQNSAETQKHWQTLYETLFAEYEKLWNEINMLTASPLTLSRTNSIGDVPWMSNMSNETSQESGTSGSTGC